MPKTPKIEINDLFCELSEENNRLKTHLLNAEKSINILIKFKNYLFEYKCDQCLCHSNEELIELKNEFNEYESNEKVVNNKAINNKQIIENESIINENQVLDNNNSICFEENSHENNGKNSGEKYKNNKGVYECDSHGCGQQFRYFSGLKRHFPIHDKGLKPFACLWSHCNRTFAQKSQMKGHYMRIHCNNKAKNELNFNTDFEDNNNNYESIEMESFEKNSRDLFECHWIGCGQEFQYLSGLKRHLLVHKKPFNCPKCEKTFAQKSNLKDHYLRIHCDNESIDNNNSNQIINNNQNQNSSQNVSQKRVNKRAIQRNSEGFYSCEWCGCGQQFQYLSGLSRHTMIHKGLKPFKCPKCDRSFAQKSNMREHYLRIHRNNEGLNQIMKSISRKYSNKSLNKSSFNQFIHNGEVYVCQWFGCELKFLSFSGIRRHLLTHRGIKPFKCLSTDCERSFAQKSNMISHYNRIHSSDQQISSLDENEVSNQSNNNVMGYENQMIAKNITNFNRDKNIKSKVRRIRSKERPINRRTKTGFYCSYSSCNQLFNSIKSLQLHEKAIHDINNPIECTFNGCNARLKSKASLEQHLKRHKTEFRCDYNECDYRTHLEHSYRYHMSKHSGQELYTCDSCDHCFTFLGALNSHMKSVHSIATPLMCEWPGCESKFGTVRGLRKHKTLHTGEKPYSCSWPACGLEFRFLSSLKTHLSSHTGLKPFKCQECDRVFAQKAYLKFHYKRIHCK